MEVLATARLFMVLGNVAALGLAFLYAQSLLGPLAALAGFLLIAFEPFDVAHTRFLHTNGLVSSLMFLSVLAFLHYLRGRGWLSLLVSGAAGGLALLTVTPAVTLAPAVALLALVERPWQAEIPGWRAAFKALLRRWALPLAVWSLALLAVVSAVWPAMWVDPLGSLYKSFAYSFLAVEGEVGGAQFVQAYQAGDQTVAAEDTSYFYYYPLNYLWRTTPVSLLGLVLLGAALLSAALARKPGSGSLKALLPGGARQALGGLLLFALVYTVLMSLGEKKFDRYYLPVYLALDIAAGLGYLAAGRLLADRLPRFKLAAGLPAGLALLAAGLQALILLPHYPYYLTYYNPLMGGAAKAPEVMMIGWGEGLNEAARYLEAQPGIEKKRILTWYALAFNWYAAPFGLQAEEIPYRYASPAELDAQLAADYAVIYANQRQRSLPPELLAALAGRTPEKVVSIHGLDYVWIYRLK
jgi:hypothetical protein